jgi:hypothetical protein
MSASIDTLTTQFAADISKFEAQMKRMVQVTNDNMNQVKKSAQQGSDEMEAILGKTNVGEALSNVFSQIKGSAIEEGASQIGVLGVALEALGPAGLIAGAGLAAMGAGLEQAKQATEWAENLKNTATALGTNTDELQKWRLAADQVGISGGTVDAALSTLNDKIGALQDGIRSKRLLPIFAQLGITPDQLATVHTSTDLMDLITEKLAQVDSAAKKTQIADALGLSGMLPLLDQSKDKLDEMFKSIQGGGNIISEALVDKLAEGAEKLKGAQEAAHSASIVLGGEFVGALQSIMEMETNVIKNTVSLIEWFKQLFDVASHANTQAMQTAGATAQRAARLQKDDQTNNWGDAALAGVPLASALSKGGRHTAALQAQGDADNAFKTFQSTNDAWNKEHPLTPPKPVSNSAVTITPPTGSHKGPADETASLDDATKAMLDSQTKALASSEAALSTALETRAKYEEDAVNADHDKTLDTIQKERDKVLSAKNDSDKAAQLKTLDEAKSEADLTAANKLALIDRNLQVALIKQSNELQQESTQVHTNQLSLDQNYYTGMANLATTAAERNAWEQKALAAAQDRENLTAQQAVADAQAGVAAALQGNADDATLSKAKTQLAIALQNQAGTNAQHGIQTAQQAKSQQGPMGQYITSLGDVNTQLENVKVKGLQSLSDGITDAIMHTKSLGAAFHDIASSIIADLVKIAVQQMIIKPIANLMGGGSGGGGGGLGFLGSVGSILGFASGTDDAPGGMALVGENGPELMYVPPHAQIAPNHLLRNSIGVGPNAGGGASHTYNLTTNVQASDAVLTSWVQQVVTQSHNQAVNTARQMAQTDSARANKNNLIR